MKRLSSVSMVFFFVMVFGAGSSFAGQTHEGQARMSLQVLDRDSKADDVGKTKARFLLDWSGKRCDFLIDSLYYHCSFDTSKDLYDSAGRLLLRGVPTVKLGPKTTQALLKNLTVGSVAQNQLNQVIELSALEWKNGLELPLYQCQDGCESIEHVINAFDHQTSSCLEISHPLLGKNKIRFTVELSKLKAIPGAVGVIGRETTQD
jgi:hypothetical protein